MYFVIQTTPFHAFCDMLNHKTKMYKEHFVNKVHFVMHKKSFCK